MKYDLSTQDVDLIQRALHYYKNAFNRYGHPRISLVLSKMETPSAPKVQYPEIAWSKPEFELRAEINGLKRILREKYGFINIPKEIA